MSYTSIPSLGYLPTLVVDADGAAAKQLADQLTRRGFAADIAISCMAADAAMRARYYGSLVFVGDLARPADLECLAGLRKRSLRTWMIMISSTAPLEAQELAFRRVADALLVAPFSMQDLTSRLLAFSLRSRPP